MPRHGQTFLGKTKRNKLFRFQVKLRATAPLCNISMVSFHSLPSRCEIVCAQVLPHAHLASGGASTVPVPQQGRKIQGPEL